jgi:hypothetical protein
MALGNLAEYLNRSPASVIIEQMRKLYMRIYPYMVLDYVHSGDMQITLGQLNAKIDALAAAMDTHVHAVPAGAVVTSTSGSATSGLPPAVLTDAIALSLILPAGVPQPTGEAVPAILPSRIGTPTEIVAIPPLNPIDPTGVV